MFRQAPVRFAQILLACLLIPASIAVSQTSETAPPQPAGPAEPNRGGGAVADFDSLMALMQTTVAPEIWESVGGTSSMQPYPGGVRVDGSAALSERAATSAQMAKLRQTLGDADETSASTDWKAASRIRVVSLTRLANHLQQSLAAKKSPDDAMLHLAGISRLRCLMYDAEQNEILVAGTVGGIVVDDAEGFRDARTGAPPIHLTDFTTALALGVGGGTFGCSIDPTPAGIVAAQQVASKGLPPAKLSDALVEAMGFHGVTVFGVAPDSPVALTLVAADVHVKQLVLDQLPAPPDFTDYFSAVQSTIGDGAPGGELLRFWFAPQRVAMRTDADGKIYAWDDVPMRLLSERELADATGQRRVAGNDARANVVAESFTTQLSTLARQYPIYHRLAAVFEAAMCGAMIRRDVGVEEATARLGLLSSPDDWMPRIASPPGRVVPLVAHQTIRDGRTRHHVTVISGGVRIAGEEALPTESDVRVYPPLDGLAGGIRKASESTDASRWWWDVQ